ncbi:MG2 domain-containing protein [Winogradskyella helgolandensis]|uniref:MG2 domain-containing protein n=1 Tax=Winogradskyella helgolandensis TaxID=2697010 RepID=UPI0015BFD8DE|nr:hypothetical protein [Winogradskyella helgolandensis]
MRTFIIPFVFLIVFFSKLNAQEIAHNTITKLSLSKHSLAEKLYLQIDNTLYQTGEKIWFKAIVAKSANNSLSDLSNILHVELIDSNKSIIDKKLLKLKDGIASSAFELQKSLKSGKYLIRAYTKWNRNFDDDFFFVQPIDIFNLKDKEEAKNPIINVAINNNEDKTLTADINPRVINPSYRGKLKLYINVGNRVDSVEISKSKDDIYKLNYKLPEIATQAELKFSTQITDYGPDLNSPKNYSKTIVLDKNYLDVQFFPEGGKLVNGFISTVACKSIDYNGLGYKIAGDIKNSKDHVITSFNSNDLGLGTFKILPRQGDTYYAELHVNDITYKYNLPVADNKGSVLSVVKLKDDLRVLLVSNTENTGNVRIQTESRGVKYHDLSLKKTDSINVSIASKSLPDGIIKWTVLNDSNQIICERLVFNNNSDNRLHLDVKSDQKTYYQREKTTINIKLDSLEIPDNISLSVLVLDTEKFRISKQYKSNLVSYLLLSSELKGFIENPSFYFDSSNRDRVFSLDALMLSQGWRNYKYQKTINTNNYRFKPEKGLVVSGTVGEYFNPEKRPTKPLDINMMVYSKPSEVFSQEIDSSGKYYFEVGDIYKPKTDIFLQVVSKKGQPIDFVVNLDKKWTPTITTIKNKNIALPNDIISTFLEKSETINRRQKEYEIAFNTIALDEVELKDYKLTPKRQKSIELHGEPSKVINGKKLQEEAPDWNNGIYSVLQIKYPEDISIQRVGKFNDLLYAKVVGSDVTHILIDNKPVYLGDYKFIQNIPVEAVESIDLIVDAKNERLYLYDIYGTHNLPGLSLKKISFINIYTYSGSGLHGYKKSEGVRIDTIEGFAKSVEFYTSDYSTLTNQDWAMPDNRSVIHWSPEIKLNRKGEYKLEFYNDDHVGEVSVIVEAISKDGKIGYSELTYNLSEAER